MFSIVFGRLLRVSFHSFDTCMKEVLHMCVCVKGNETDESVACFVGICCREKIFREFLCVCV